MVVFLRFLHLFIYGKQEYYLHINFISLKMIKYFQLIPLIILPYFYLKEGIEREQDIPNMTSTTCSIYFSLFYLFKVNRDDPGIFGKVV